MKTTTLTRLILILAFIAIPSLQAQVPTGDEGFVKLEIKGMACPFCAGGLGKAFEAVEGVKTVDIDFEHGLAYLTVSNKNIPDEKTLKEIVIEAGFKPGNMDYSEVPFDRPIKKKRSKRKNYPN